MVWGRDFLFYPRAQWRTNLCLRHRSVRHCALGQKITFCPQTISIIILWFNMVIYKTNIYYFYVALPNGIETHNHLADLLIYSRFNTPIKPLKHSSYVYSYSVIFFHFFILSHIRNYGRNFLTVRNLWYFCYTDKETKN